ncbi:MAG: cupin domain-containing protein [Chloroflexi bacterium]|nr:cupin domain-containing protein [Chloroflexota bacterium]
MLRHNHEARTVEMAPGVVRRTLNSGDRTTLAEITLEQGAVVPLHTHEHEQIGYLAKGRMLFEVGEETRELQAGDSWLVPSNVPHRVTALEASVAVDVFSPVRTEYLD